MEKPKLTKSLINNLQPNTSHEFFEKLKNFKFFNRNYKLFSNLVNFLLNQTIIK